MMAMLGIWDASPSFTAGETTLSAGKPKFTDNCKARPKTLSRLAKINKAVGCNSTRDATRKIQDPADTEVFSGFECSTGNGDLGRGETQRLRRPNQPNMQLHGF